MARLIDSPTGGGPIGPFEQQLVDLLKATLPTDYVLVPNVSMRENNGQSHEYDIVVLAPHAVYVVEDACRGIDTGGSLAAAWTAMEKAGVKRISSEDLDL